ncbi:unnamed protein product, partial [marine sediment metagenome]
MESIDELDETGGALRVLLILYKEDSISRTKLIGNAGFVRIINTEIPVRDYQTKYAFPGGRTVELDVTDRSMRKVNAQMFFLIEDGILKVV